MCIIESALFMGLLHSMDMAAHYLMHRGSSGLDAAACGVAQEVCLCVALPNLLSVHGPEPCLGKLCSSVFKGCYALACCERMVTCRVCILKGTGTLFSHSESLI